MEGIEKSKGKSQTPKTILCTDLKARCYNFSAAIIRFVDKL